MFSGEQLKSPGTPSYDSAMSAAGTTLPLLVEGFSQQRISYEGTGTLLTPEQVLDRMAINAHIPIANGYVLVPDYRPEGEENEFIPHDTFTWYFMNSLVPYASSGKHWAHDRRHGPSYYRLFLSASFANCVRESAAVSYNHGLTFNFSAAMDYLGDSHVLLSTPFDRADTGSDFGHVLSARLYLQRLIRLREGENPVIDRKLNWREQRQFGAIWYETGFADLESRVERELNALPADIRHQIIELNTPIQG